MQNKIPMYGSLPLWLSWQRICCNAETWVRSLGWEDLLEKGKATHSSILAREFHGLYSPWGGTDMTDFHLTNKIPINVDTGIIVKSCN